MAYAKYHNCSNCIHWDIGQSNGRYIHRCVGKWNTWTKPSQRNGCFHWEWNGQEGWDERDREKQEKEDEVIIRPKEKRKKTRSSKSSLVKFVAVVIAGIIAFAVISSLVQSAKNSYHDKFGPPIEVCSAVKWPSNGNTYQLFEYQGSQTWDQARKFCKKQGGHLATISSEHENAFLLEGLVSQNIPSAFFGFTDKNGEGNWKWAHKVLFQKKAIYTNWEEGYPQNNQGDNYAMLTTGQEGKWKNAQFEQGNQFFICEWESGAKKGPSAIKAEWPEVIVTV